MAPRPLLILALDTSTRAASVALLRGAELVGELTTRDERMQSERLLPAVDALLGRVGVPFAAVDAFAVTIGPGSFTGLRIGLSTVKGLAFARPRPVAPVSTLAALAEAAPADDAPVLALLDAQRGELYAALHRSPAAEPAPAVVAGAALEGLLPAAGRVWIAAGEGARAAAERLARSVGPRAALLPPARCVASAARVGRLGAAVLARGGGLAPEALVPRYVRRAEAEVRRTGARFEG